MNFLYFGPVHCIQLYMYSYLQVKSLKQKLADELAKAITAKDGSSLSISEHDEIVSQIKCEAAQAHKEMLESMNMVPKGMFIISTNYHSLLFHFISYLIVSIFGAILCPNYMFEKFELGT